MWPTLYVMNNNSSINVYFMLSKPDMKLISILLLVWMMCLLKTPLNKQSKTYTFEKKCPHKYMSLFAYLMWFSTFISPLGIFYQDRENSGAKGTYLQNAKWHSK